MLSLTAKHLPPHSFSNVSASVATYAATFSHTISSPLTMILEGVLGEAHVVVLLVVTLQPGENLQRLLRSRRRHLHLASPPGEASTATAASPRQSPARDPRLRPQARTVVTATNSPRVLRRSWAAQSGWRASVATRLLLGLALPLASMASVRANFASGSREYGLKNTSLWRLLTLSTLKVMLLLR